MQSVLFGITLVMSAHGVFRKSVLVAGGVLVTELDCMACLTRGMYFSDSLKKRLEVAGRAYRSP